jgi:uncharacterized protein YfkK (UPF0435 family)
MKYAAALLCVLLPVLCFAQKDKLQRSNLKFGEIKTEDFGPTAYEVDSSAAAVVLADIGQSKFEGNNKGFFDIVYKKHKRLRIMNKNGFDEATISIRLYQFGNDEEKIEDFEAATYNVENGKVTVTKLDKASIFKDKINKNISMRKFTFPNIREGSIIEFKYTIKSRFPLYPLRDWEFQGSLPRIWSEYSVSIPAMFDYLVLGQNTRSFDIDDSQETNGMFSILVPGEDAYSSASVVNIQGKVYNNVWAVKDMPALKNEPFTTTVDNHIQKIEFELRSIRWPSGKVDDILGNWMKFADGMLKDEDFGAELNKNNAFSVSDVKKIADAGSTDKEKAMKIYAYVRDNFTCNDHDALWMSNPLKKTWQGKAGNVADINLLLIAMLRTYGYDAKPVILSTRNHGKAYELYPLTAKFNYVLARLKLGEEYVLLDASESKLGFGKLPLRAYNGYARIMDLPVPALIGTLFADSVKETKITSVFIMNNEDGKGMSGSFTSNLGYYESYNLRDKLAKTTKEDFFKDVKKAYSFETELENTSLEAEKVYEEPMVVKYDFKFSTDEDILYINPMLTEATKENLFSSATRQYPVEMPFSFSETYVFNMEIPKGYKVEELPKSTRVKLNDDEGIFEYIINSNGTNIQFRMKLALNKATFPKEDYETLRDFYAMVVKKQSEQIVLKKIK